MGIIEEVGPCVKTFKKGDRVVEAFDIACGSCSFCKEGLFSECDTTNPSADMQQLYGDRICGFHGYSHLTGGISGGQSQFARCRHGEWLPGYCWHEQKGMLLHWSFSMQLSACTIMQEPCASMHLIAGPVGTLTPLLHALAIKRVLAIGTAGQRLSLLCFPEAMTAD